MAKSTSLAIAAAVVAGIAVIGYGYFSALDGGPQGPAPDDATVVAQGQAIYDAQCASCHGANLEGQPDWRTKNPDGTLPAPPHDASGHTWHHADSLLFKITKEGGASIAPPGFKSAMPAFGAELSDADIWAVLSFIKSRWPADARRRQDDMSRRAG